jgi:lipopolysaccharide/colanic/teichoic acid biosynthesis glycosyltransferase
MLRWLLRDASGWTGRFRDSSADGLLPLAEFHRMLERERARVDRWGGQFSLLTLGTGSRGTGQTTLKFLLPALRRRLRLTDEMGWLDRHHVGVILPNSPAWGAWTVADDLCREFPPTVPIPTCAVYVYPTQLPVVNENGAVATRAPGGRTARAMEVLFCRRLPLWKRACDLLGAGAGLILSFPVMLLIGAAIKATSPGPVLFTQWRRGLGGRPFRMYKFRSMVSDAEARKRHLIALNEQDGPAFKIKGDPRVTVTGRWLRATSLDELPQLWNVLRGDMSLVGPRPLPLAESDACEVWQRNRLDCTPGLTCLWQARKRLEVSFTQWMRMDIRYLRSRSFWGDVKLMIETVPAVFFGKNH